MKIVSYAKSVAPCHDLNQDGAIKIKEDMEKARTVMAGPYIHCVSQDVYPTVILRDAVVFLPESSSQVKTISPDAGTLK